jgi:hypothetical protein
MDNDPLPLIQAVFHVILLIAVHSQTARRGPKAAGRQRVLQVENPRLPASSRLRAGRVTNTRNERKTYETRQALSKPVALSQELQAKSCHSNPAGSAGYPGRSARPD